MHIAFTIFIQKEGAAQALIFLPDSKTVYFRRNKPTEKNSKQTDEISRPVRKGSDQ